MIFLKAAALSTILVSTISARLRRERRNNAIKIRTLAWKMQTKSHQDSDTEAEDEGGDPSHQAKQAQDKEGAATPIHEDSDATTEDEGENDSNQNGQTLAGEVTAKPAHEGSEPVNKDEGKETQNRTGQGLLSKDDVLVELRRMGKWKETEHEQEKLDKLAQMVIALHAGKELVEWSTACVESNQENPGAFFCFLVRF